MAGIQLCAVARVISSFVYVQTEAMKHPLLYSFLPLTLNQFFKLWFGFLFFNTGL